MVLEFLSEVFASWVEWVGIVLTIFALVEKVPRVKEWLHDKPLIERFVPLIWVVAIFCVGYGFYAAWHNQFKRAEQAEGQVKSLTSADITGDIELGVIGQQGIGSHAALVIEVRNSGAPSGIPASSWRLTAIDPSGGRHTGSANTLANANLDFCLDEKRVMRFVRADALDIKTTSAIGRNESKQGLLWFDIPSLPAPILKDPNTSLLVEADTVSGQHVSISSTVARLMELSSRPGIFLSGIENPRPLDMPCKENEKYPAAPQ